MAKKTPLILGGCGCASVLLGVVLLGAWFLSNGKSFVTGLTHHADDTVHYKSSSAGLTGNLAENYVDFELDYPKTWIVKPDPQNYLSIERKIEGDQTCENLNVGYFDTAGSEEGDRTIYPQLVQQLQAQFAGQFEGLQKVSEGPTKVGNYDAYEARFAAPVSSEGKQLEVYIRAVLLPTPDHAKGVSLLMMGTSLCPDLHGAADLGDKGELPDVLRSFRFTK